MKRGEEGRQRIVDAGLHVARCEGLVNVNAQRIAKELGRERGGIVYHFPDRASLHEAVVALAFERHDVHVLAMLIIAKHPSVSALSQSDRQGILLAASI